MPAQLIVALDFDSADEALAWSARLDPTECILKIGSELFTSCGPNMVQKLIARGYRVFLDLKYHDIPQTVARACQAAANMGVWMVNVHALGGLDMMKAARDALAGYGAQRPKLIAVTLLTSHDLQIVSELGFQRSFEDQALALAKLAQQAGLDGIVSSAWEVPAIKQHCGSSFLCVTPGIRLQGDKHDDQSRVMTPHEAQAHGADYLVIGRSLRRAAEPHVLLHQLYTELNHSTL
jgi:orotidine-5'-phosphate decarboxylase